MIKDLQISCHVVFPLFFAIATAPFAQVNAQDAESKLPDSVSRLVVNLPEDTNVGIVVTDRKGDVVFQHNSTVELPSASSIKAFLLLELFSKYATELDLVERDDIGKIVKDESHPAISHFKDESKKLIAKELSVVSIKQLGKILIDSEDQSGRKYANVVYNAASNVAISLLGGPAECTALVHQRDKAFKDVNIRRYMLASRDVTGDNTASPIGLATLYQIAIGRTPNGMSTKVVREVEKILHVIDYENGAKLYGKGGTLYSDPVTHVRSGQYKSGKIRMNYAIMATQKLKSPETSKTQYDVLNKLTLDIYTGMKNAK